MQLAVQVPAHGAAAILVHAAYVRGKVALSMQFAAYTPHRPTLINEGGQPTFAVLLSVLVPPVANALVLDSRPAAVAVQLPSDVPRLLASPQHFLGGKVGVACAVLCLAM